MKPGGLLVLLGLVACSSGTKTSSGGGTTGGGPGSPGTGEQLDQAADRDDCTTDEDCALVEACCGCNAGGRKVGIRADAVATYEATREKRCSGQMCAQSISDHPSCNAEPVCRKGHCRAQPHMNHAPDPTQPPATTPPATP